jgi:SAM-dependent methyltransferase
MSQTPPATAFADAAATWNRRFEGDEFLFGTEPNAWLKEHAAVWPKGGRVLCVADGESRNSVWLARQGFVVDAFDIAEAGVAKARRLAQQQGVAVNYEVADCDGYGWPQASCDGVAAIFVQFADPSQRERLFARMVASLRPGGTLVLHGYTPKQLEYRTGGPPHASHLYTPQLLREAFAALEILELREYEADVAEGSGHRGRSALIGLVARRR